MRQVLISRGVRSGGAEIQGVIPADQRTVSDLLQSVKEGVGGGAGACATRTVLMAIVLP